MASDLIECELQVEMYEASAVSGQQSKFVRMEADESIHAKVAAEIFYENDPLTKAVENANMSRVR